MEDFETQVFCFVFIFKGYLPSLTDTLAHHQRIALPFSIYERNIPSYVFAQMPIIICGTDPTTLGT
jgi:hypothetical protein